MVVPDKQREKTYVFVSDEEGCVIDDGNYEYLSLVIKHAQELLKSGAWGRRIRILVINDKGKHQTFGCISG